MKSKTHNSKFTLISTILLIMPFVLSGVSTVQADAPWEQIHKLLAADGAAEDLFGRSVAIDGNLAVIGAFFDGDNGFRSGSAYVFDVATGGQLFKLLASDGTEGDRFGWSVAISGNLAVIGAYLNGDNGLDSGSAYVFDVTTGQQLFKLLPSDAEAEDQFGFSVAIDGNLAVIGARLDDNGSGSAYVFDVTTGQQLFKLLASDGMTSDNFGTSVAIDGNLAVIGARTDGDNGSFSGSAYVFDVTTGQQLFKLLAADGAEFDSFGGSVAIDGHLAVIGAVGDNDIGTRSGSSYVFDVTTGQQLFKLLASDGTEGDQFGSSIAISGNLAVIAASADDENGSHSGSVYIFDVTTGQQLFKLLAADGAAFDFFGRSVAISGNLAFIGADGDNDNGSDSGSVYVFQPASCLDLSAINLIAGKKALFAISNGTPGTRGVTIYGTKAGQTIVNNINGYCATFGIKGVTQSKVLGGLNQIFDANGVISFNQQIPPGTTGTRVFFQSAMRGTCPDECMSNLLDMTIQ